MSQTLLAADNPTRAYIANAVAAGGRNVPLDVNPALAGLSALLLESEGAEVEYRCCQCGAIERRAVKPF